MSNIVLDASALLALSNREPGHEVVAKHLPGALISAVNLSEVYAKALAKGSLLEDVSRYVRQLPLVTVAFDDQQAAVAATFRQQARNLKISFADTACLALGLVSDSLVLTADHDWEKLEIGAKLKLFR